MLNRETFLYFLQKPTGQCYLLNNGHLNYTTIPTWLKNSPGGWFDSELSFGRNIHYWGLNRSYSNSYSFYKDGQDIIRNLLYTSGGIQGSLCLVVNKFNPATGIYEAYYKGEIDIPHVDDNPLESIKAPVIQGGLQKLIKAYENTYFEIPCDGSIPQNISVEIDGYLFHTVLTYNVVPFTVQNSGIIIPMVLYSSTGNDIGVVKGDQKYQAIDPNPVNYGPILATSQNFTYTNYKSSTVTVQGSILLNGNLANGNLKLYTSLGQSFDLIPTANLAAGEYNISQAVTLVPGENIFLLLFSTGGNPNVDLSQIQLVFDSKLDVTYTYAIKPFDLLDLLLQKICQLASSPGYIYNYTLQSNLLTQNSNLCLTSGQSLRNEANAVIKTKLSDFYDSFDAVLSASMGVQSDANGNDQLFFERLGYVLDSSSVDMNVGEVAELKIQPAQDLFFDTVVIGYPEQKYDDIIGNLEFNTTCKWKAPLTPFNSVHKEFKKVSVYRGDMFGIESTRKNINSVSNSSNNRSDNDVFFLNTDLTQSNNTIVVINSVPTNVKSNNNLAPLNQVAYSTINGTGIAADFSKATVNSANDTIRYAGPPTSVLLIANLSGTYIPNPYTFHTGLGFLGTWNTYSYPSVEVYIQFIKNGAIVNQLQTTLNSGKTFNYWYTANINLQFGDSIYINIVPVDPTLPYLYNSFNALVSASFTIQSTGAIVYGVKRGSYTSITGVENASSVYNLEDLSPMLMLQNHGDYIRSVLFNYTGQNLSFLTTDKNANVSRTLQNGNTITECSNVPIGNLNSNILFYPFYLNYKTNVPINFNQVLENAANGHIQNSFIGINAYGFPFDVKQKPAINESQTWKLLISPATSLTDILNIEFNAINTVALMALGSYWSYLNPVKWYPYDFAKPAQYNFIHMDQDVQGRQTRNLAYPAQYLQKWQQNDTIELQCITNGLSPVVIKIIDLTTVINGDLSTGNVTASFTLTETADPSVVNPYSMFQGDFALTDIPEGIYQMVAIIGTGNTITEWKSEPFAIAAKWPDTMLFQYTDTNNKWTTIFTQGYNPQFRIEAKLGKYNTESKFTQFEDQPADIETVNGIPYRTFQLLLGWRTAGIPPWARELLEYILLLETCEIDGIGFTRSNEAKFEEEEFSGWPMSSWKLKVRQSTNKFGSSLTTDGSVDDQMLVTYPIDVSLFGDGNNDGTITITDFE